MADSAEVKTSEAPKKTTPEAREANALRGIKEEVDKKFGHMINAFEYGTPPHGGIAPGLDRLLMVLWECDSIRDIYAFPKNGRAQDVMLGAPGKVKEKQLKELHIKIVD